MPNPTYLDFDLSIETSRTGYRARVIRSALGEAAVKFALPLAEMQLGALASVRGGFIPIFARPATAGRTLLCPLLPGRWPSNNASFQIAVP